MNELVSIIMPAYNCEQFIEESINSVLNQTYQNWELIVINDYSTDNTEATISKYKDKRIKHFKNEKNMGVAYSRNKGIKLSTSNYVAFLDSDDIWHKNKLEKQIKLMNEGKDFVFTGSSFIDETGKKINYILDIPKKINKEELLKQNIISCSSVLIDKDLLLKHPFPEMIRNIHEDYATWLSILDEKECAFGLNEPLLIYRINRKSKSHNKFKALLMNINVYKYIKLNGIEIIKYMLFYMYRNINKYYKLHTK